MENFLYIIVAILSVIIVVAVASQESEQAGLGTLDGSSGATWGKNRGSSKKEILNKVISICSVIFIVCMILIARFKIR